VTGFQAGVLPIPVFILFFFFFFCRRKNVRWLGREEDGKSWPSPQSRGIRETRKQHVLLMGAWFLGDTTLKVLQSNL